MSIGANGLSVLNAMFNFLRPIVERGIEVVIPFKATGELSMKLAPNGFKPRWIVIHHSFSTDNSTRNWDSIRTYHMSYRCQGEIITREMYLELSLKNTSGLETPWHDIGYTFGIENVNGTLTVLNGRKIGEIGAHALGFNDKSIGICLIGNYNLDAPSDDRLFTLSCLCRQLQYEFGIPRDQVIGHRETYGKLNPPQPVAKSCPGSQFDLDKFRARLRA